MVKACKETVDIFNKMYRRLAMNQNTNQILFALLRSAICGTSLKDNEKALFSSELLPDLFTLTKKHDIIHLLAFAIKKNKLIADNKELENILTAIIYKSIMRYEKLNKAYEGLCALLENAQIPFIPLKGSVIRKYYPEPWMRTSSDIDVLIRHEDLEKAIALLKETGPSRESRETKHDISLYFQNGVHIELHYDLIEEGRANKANAILQDVWKNSVLKDGYKYWYEMSDEFFYFYHIAHMAKHFEYGGCGIRTFLDLWLLNNIDNTNQKKREELLKTGGLLPFAKATEKLCKCWLDEELLDDISLRMEKYILDGGVYGSTQNGIEIQKQRKGGKIGYVLSNLFIPYDVIKRYYPILEKYPWLTPLMQIRRWGRIIFCGDIKRVASQISYSDTDNDKIMTLQELLTGIGL